MGSKYTVLWKYGNSVVERYDTNHLVVAMFKLFFTEPSRQYVWKTLEMR